MKQLNKVELIGHVGSVRTSQFESGRTGYFFSVATNYAYKGSNGELVAETTWHNISYFSKFPIDIEKGSAVHVYGRLRNKKYTGTDGIERQITEILASNVSIVETTENESTSAAASSERTESTRQYDDLPEAFL